VDLRSGSNAQTLYDQLKAFVADCADHLDHVAPRPAAQLHRASTHWLRHTEITHSLVAGTPLDVEMKVAGYASITTTSQYSYAETRRRLPGSAGAGAAALDPAR
jgi:hypothetical protein